MDYKKYSLENLENWLHDAMSAGEATSKEIYDVIVGVVRENYYIYKNKTSEAYELLALLNDNSYEHSSHYYEYDRNDSNRKNPFTVEREATYDQMIANGYTMTDDGFWIPPEKQDKVVKWQLPVQVDGLTGDCFVEFPDDLLERAGLKEGDIVNWVDNKDGSYTLTKVTKQLEMDEC